VVFRPAWQPRSQPTLADSGSTTGSGGRCVTWPIFSSNSLHIIRLRGHGTGSTIRSPTNHSVRSARLAGRPVRTSRLAHSA
jgi:hypothetical protein